ncbi:hypothetical protein GS451_01900 [Rhodococcus hoagii]|nr:hypothetical protein [Prescottella equi]
MPPVVGIDVARRAENAVHAMSPTTSPRTCSTASDVDAELASAHRLTLESRDRARPPRCEEGKGVYARWDDDEQTLTF